MNLCGFSELDCIGLQNLRLDLSVISINLHLAMNSKVHMLKLYLLLLPVKYPGWSTDLLLCIRAPMKILFPVIVQYVYLDKSFQ